MEFTELFTPIKIGKLEIKNRLCMYRVHLRQ
jgi:2,4-dienoyl-CoA reductase-like NADH-dependent reductase (Old Yellow Enzyme family)